LSGAATPAQIRPVSSRSIGKLRLNIQSISKLSSNRWWEVSSINRGRFMLWVKSFHIISVVCWFAVLFYLPRLFVYHAMSEDQISKDRFKLMERKLLRGIGTPSMIATYIFGIWTAAYAWDYYKISSWFWLKIILVGILTVYHYLCIYFWRQFCADNNHHKHTFYRWFNEIPVLMLVAIVFLVVIQPNW
jgi:putative membrane protein